MSRTRGLWLAAGLICAFAAGGWAATGTEPAPADADTPSGTAASNDAESEAAQKETPAPSAQATEDAPTPPAEVFVPSEAISEDIAVPFPVDI